MNEAAIKINTLQGIESSVVVEVLNAKQRYVLPKKMFRELSNNFFNRAPLASIGLLRFQDA